MQATPALLHTELTHINIRYTRGDIRPGERTRLIRETLNRFGQTPKLLH